MADIKGLVAKSIYRQSVGGRKLQWDPIGNQRVVGEQRQHGNRPTLFPLSFSYFSAYTAVIHFSSLRLSSCGLHHPKWAMRKLYRSTKKREVYENISIVEYFPNIAVYPQYLCSFFFKTITKSVHGNIRFDVDLMSALSVSARSNNEKQQLSC